MLLGFVSDRFKLNNTFNIAISISEIGIINESKWKFVHDNLSENQWQLNWSKTLIDKENCWSISDSLS